MPDHQRISTHIFRQVDRRYSVSTNQKPRRKTDREKESQAKRRTHLKAERDAAPRKPKQKDRNAPAAKSDLIRKDDRAPKSFDQWREMMWNSIMMNPTLSETEQDDLAEQISKIGVEAQKGHRADPERLQKAINVLAVMEPDVFEVALGTLPDLLAEMGLAISKIDGKARLESRQRRAG